MAPDQPRTSNPVYELFVLGLSVYVILALAIEAIADLSPDVSAVLLYVDTGVCLLFLLDFLYNLVRARDRVHYFVTWGWLDLLSSIPFAGPARLGRAARIVRIIRVLRGFRSVRNLAGFVLKRRAQAAFASVAFVSLLLVVFSSIVVLQFEPLVPGSNIRTGGDALWWAYVTITSVGYGDFYPVTPEGRTVGAVLMTAGMGLFGTFTGFVASWFVAAPARHPAGSGPAETPTPAAV